MQKENDNFQNLLNRAAYGDAESIAPLMKSRDARIIKALISNPAFPVEQLVALLRQRRLSLEDIRKISENKFWISHYKIKYELVANPVTPRHIALSFIKDLYQNDLAVIARNVTLHPAVRQSAENYLQIRLTSMRVGERIALAKTAVQSILRFLIHDVDNRVVAAALNNFRLKESDVQQLAADKKTSNDKLELIYQHPKWSKSQVILKELALNPGLSYSLRRRVFECSPIPFLVQMIYAPQLTVNDRKLAEFVTRQKLKNLPDDQLLLLTTTHSIRLLKEILAIAEDEKVLNKLLDNRKITEEVLVGLLGKRAYRRCKDVLKKHSRWEKNEAVQRIIK